MKTDCPDMEILLAEFAADELEAAIRKPVNLILLTEDPVGI